MKIDNIISSLGKNGSNLVRANNSIKWCNGDRDKCKALFIEIFKAVDKTITEFQYLEEYDEVVNWMTDTKGKGLLLMGGCGKGKSIIATGVIPVLLKIATNCEVRPISTKEYGSKANRPAFSALDKTKIRAFTGIKIPFWRESLIKCIEEIKNNN